MSHVLRTADTQSAPPFASGGGSPAVSPADSADPLPPPALMPGSGRRPLKRGAAAAAPPPRPQKPSPPKPAPTPPEDVPTRPSLPPARGLRALTDRVAGSLQARISLLTGGLTLLLSLTLSVGTGIGARSWIEGNAGQALGRYAQESAAALDRETAARARILSLAAAQSGLSGGRQASAGERRRVLDGLRAALPGCAWVGLKDPRTGAVLASSGTLTRAATLSIRVPVRATGNGVGRRLYLIARTTPGAWAREAGRTLPSPPSGLPRAQLFVLDRGGVPLLASPKGSAGAAATTGAGGASRLPGYQAAFGGGTGFTRGAWAPGGEYLTGFAPTRRGYNNTAETGDGRGWVVLARVPLADALAPAREMQRQAILFSMAAGLICALGGWRMAARLTGPARSIAETADRIRAGDSAAADRLPVVPPGGGAAHRDEVTRMAEALGALVRALQRREEQLAQANRRLEGELTAREEVLTERARLMAEVQVASVRQRRLLRDLLRSVTEDRLRLCDSDRDLPPKLAHLVGGPVPLARASLRALRQAAEAAAEEAGLGGERRPDLLLAVGEAGMNAVVHAGGGVGRVYHDGAGKVQVWVTDHGKGIAEHNIPRATLEKGFTTAGTMGHGFPLILRCCDRVWLLTGAAGTTVVVEMDREEPQMAWLRERGLEILTQG